MNESATQSTVEELVRNSYGPLIAFLGSRSGDVAGAEDALSEAFAAAPGRMTLRLACSYEDHQNPQEMQAPTPRPPLALRSIALFETVKGLLALAAACGVLSLRHTDLHAATDALLLRHGIDPERRYTRLFIESVAKATNSHAGEIVALAFAYALIRLVEGYGLWQGRHWAEWFAVISAGIFLPLEFWHFVHRPTALNTGVMVFNIVIIIYLTTLLNQRRRSRERAGG